MLDKGEITTKQCRECRDKKLGVTFSLGLMSFHLCLDCIDKALTALGDWREKLVKRIYGEVPRG